MIFKNTLDCYQAIGTALANAAPPDWTSIKAEITLDGLRVDAVVSCTSNSGKQNGHLTGIPRLASHFYDLAQLLNSNEKGLFKSCVFTIQNNGKYDADFTY